MHANHTSGNPFPFSVDNSKSNRNDIFYSERKYTTKPTFPNEIKPIEFKYSISRISRVEESALRELRKLIFSQKGSLLQEFRKYDTEHTGKMLVLIWKLCIGQFLVSQLDIPSGKSAGTRDIGLDSRLRHLEI